LILTGQRREEIGGLRFDELRTDPAGNLGRIELPPPRTKPKRAHTIPLSGPAQAILTPWLSTPTASPFVFGNRPFVSWSLGKCMLDEALVKAKIEIPPWVVHDIRRAVATGLADNVDTLPHVIEAVLNHSGRKADAIFGIDTKLRETYVKSVYENGKRNALRAWADHIMAAVEGRPAVVVPMRDSASAARQCQGSLRIRDSAIAAVRVAHVPLPTPLAPVDGPATNPCRGPLGEQPIGKAALPWQQQSSECVMGDPLGWLCRSDAHQGRPPPEKRMRIVDKNRHETRSLSLAAG
jgi:hypothetical protein